MAITTDDAMGNKPTGETTTDNPKPEAAPASDDASGLPEEVLKFPIFNSLMNGTPPAVYAATDAKIPEIKVIDKYATELRDAGFSAYGTLDGNNKVLFNQLIVSPDEIKAADENGTLLGQLAIPYEELAAGYESAKLKGDETPSEAPTVPAGGMPSPASSATDKKLAAARIANIAIGSPTSGPAPGQGRILNSALKPVV